jgi:hypothetical protein
MVLLALWLPSGNHDRVCCLLQLEQLGKQDRFVTARARASQPQSMAKKPALWATPLTEAALATLATLIQGVGD